MGIEPDGEFGRDCPHCWGAGATPKNIWLAVSGIKLGSLAVPGNSPAPNGDHKLTQRDLPGNSCEWKLIDGNFSFTLTFFANRSQLTIRSAVPNTGVFFDDAAKCEHLFTNERIAEVGNVYYGGIAQRWTV